MATNDDSSNSDTSSETNKPVIVATLALKLKKLRDALQMQPPMVNPPCPIKLTGAQWMHRNMHHRSRCIDNFRMYPEAFQQLHEILLNYGLKSTRECTSMEILGMYVWICAQGASARRARDRFERSLDTISRKTSEVSEVMFRWAQSMLVPEDSNYQGVHSELQRYAPWFDGCIGAIDGTHIPVEVNQAAKADFIDRNGEVSINVCAIVDMHGRFTYVGAGKAGSCHDMAVLRDCEEDPRFPKPPPGRYYLADSGYALREGYITPFLHTRYHSPEFEGVDLRNLSREEKFNYIHAKMRNVIERRFGILKSRWQIVHDGVPFMNREKQSKIIISCFALDNYLWLLKHGAGSKYVVSEWVYMNATASASQLREWISAAVWFT